MFIISGHCYKLIIYLPRTQSHHTDGVSIWAFLYLSHKLSQLGVCPTAVVNLKITKSHNDCPLLLLCHVLKNFMPKMCKFNLLFTFKYNLLSSHVLLPDHLRNQSCIEFSVTMYSLTHSYIEYSHFSCILCSSSLKYSCTTMSSSTLAPPTWEDPDLASASIFSTSISVGDPSRWNKRKIKSMVLIIK